METIFALATARGRAGLAVIRVSGPDARAACARLAGPLPEHGRSLRRLSWEGGLLDEALVLTFAPGRSFTGEETVELHLHGSPAVIAAVSRVLERMPGLRPARAGEFTRRALENERLDLARIEGLADLVDAETEAQRRQAVRLFSGELGTRAAEWRTRLIRAAALLEATIDFADEEVPVDVTPEVTGLLSDVAADLGRQIAGQAAAERVRSGFEVAILGAPNVGKSTLLNALAGRDAALTSEIAGTTRDVIEVHMDLGGLAVTVLDTAGLRETADRLERAGIERARARAATADLRVHLLEPGARPGGEWREGDIAVRAKADLHPDGEGVSGLTGAGVDGLVARIAATLAERSAGAGLAVRERHREAMERAAAFLAAAAGQLDGEATDLAAEELRGAIAALDSLVGRVDVEQVLDEIFSSFCIGK